MTGQQLIIKHLRTFALAFSLIFVGGGMLTACSEEGTAEKAGEKIDEAVESAGETMDHAADYTSEALDDAGDAMDEAAEDASDALDDKEN